MCSGCRSCFLSLSFIQITFVFLLLFSHHYLFLFFFFNDPPPPEFYPLPLHAPLPIWRRLATIQAFATACESSSQFGIPERPSSARHESAAHAFACVSASRSSSPRTRHASSAPWKTSPAPDRKSTRLNSSHLVISYAVF